MGLIKMIKCCDVCGSIIINDDCSNDRCPDKLARIEEELDKIMDSIDDCTHVIVCPRNGTGCYVNKPKNESSKHLLK